MRRYQCNCGNTLFFDNSLCVNCGMELGFCPTCKNLVPLLKTEIGYRCGNDACGASLSKCSNYSQYQVCNRCVVSSTTEGQELCECCHFNQTIPDLTIPGNLERWRRLESAKRRLFYDLDRLALPYETGTDQFELSLAFDFKADAIPEGNFWRSVGKDEKVYTGHSAGLITINIREADDVQREMLRVELGESHRTLIGHFRHEIGHYYWDLLVRGRSHDQGSWEDEFRSFFGNHETPSYAEALENYYQNGPSPDWHLRCISPYASMHPWEDFAETWAVYLDLISILDTATHNGFECPTNFLEMEVADLVAEYQRLGIALNELNRSVGLIDAVPEIFVPPVLDKLNFIHRLVRSAGELKTAPGIESSDVQTAAHVAN